MWCVRIFVRIDLACVGVGRVGGREGVGGGLVHSIYTVSSRWVEVDDACVYRRGGGRCDMGAEDCEHFSGGAVSVRRPAAELGPSFLSPSFLSLLLFSLLLFSPSFLALLRGFFL